MRACALGAIIGLTFGLGDVAAAVAADLPSGRAVDSSLYYAPQGRRAGMLVIYDDQPGVVIRAYWLAPWRNRHYFPATDEMPAVGRDEDLSKRSHPQRAKTYRRYWSTTSAFAPGYMRGRGPDVDAEPWQEPAEPSLK
jgi:hypothetical protein